MLDFIAEDDPQGLKNVILKIGDGMGLLQVSAAWVTNRGKLNIDNCSTTGLMRTWCSDKLISDLGAVGTKTNCHSISVDLQGNKLILLTDIAHANGLKIDIVIICNLSEATPAVFCAHNIDIEAEIVIDYLDCNVDYLFSA